MRYLLTAGEEYYPSTGGGNMIKLFDHIPTIKEVEVAIREKYNRIVPWIDWIILVDLTDFSESHYSIDSVFG